MIKSLYIHIPFCDNICSYCDFAKVFSSTFSHKSYLDCLIKEIEEEKIPENSLDTIYIGGGTPSSLSNEELDILLSYLHRRFPDVNEFTLEANPESLTPEKIRTLSLYHVNRVSLGAQSMNDTILSTLNRKHTTQDIMNCVLNLRKNGIKNINLDFIYGFEQMEMKDIDDDISFATGLKIPHLSFYSLQIEEGTLLYNQKARCKNDDELRSMYDHILDELEKKGYRRYEVSNFSIPGYESIHNQTYWHDEEYYAAGLSASGYVGKTRFTNTRSMNHYLEGKLNRSVETIDKAGEEFEFLMLNLRLVKGFSLETFKKRFHKDFLMDYRKEIQDVIEYVDYSDGYFRIKKEYIYTMDSILLKILR